MLRSDIPVTLNDIQNIIENLPNLRKFFLNCIPVDIPDLHSPPAITKWFTLCELRIDPHDCTVDVYPFVKAQILHLFDEIDVLVLFPPSGHAEMPPDLEGMTPLPLESARDRVEFTDWPGQNAHQTSHCVFPV